MILNNIACLIEQVAYSDENSEFTRNLDNLGEFVKNFTNPKVLSSDSTSCGCASGGAVVEASIPSYLQDNGAGIASNIANKLANSVRFDQ